MQIRHILKQKKEPATPAAKAVHGKNKVKGNYDPTIFVNAKKEVTNKTV